MDGRTLGREDIVVLGKKYELGGGEALATKFGMYGIFVLSLECTIAG